MKKKVILIGVLLLLVITVIGVSYAAFSYSQTGAYENTITTGEISMSYDETSKVINMNGALPTTDETGKASLVEGEYFDFSVTTHIVGDTNINWEISAKALESNTFDGSNVRLYLTKIVDGEEVEVMSPRNYSENTTSNSYTGRPSGEMSLLMGSTSEQGDVTTNYRLRMWVDEDYNPQEDTAGKTFSVEVNVYGRQGNPISAVDTLLAKANDASIINYTDGNTGEMYVFSHEAGEQQVGWTEEELTDYRYIGANPNNYVTFNDELWRIIGVFTVEDENGNKEQRIKIMRNTASNLVWDSEGNNDWSTASLNTYLNGDYYNNLTSESQQIVGSTKWYLGGSDVVSLSAPSWYDTERGENVISGHATNWIGKIGLIYPSDYAYSYSYGVDDNCYNDTSKCYQQPYLGFDSYLIQNASADIWTINPSSSQLDRAIAHGGSGSLSFRDITSVYPGFMYQPTLYLLSNVQIIGGNGSSSLPYQLSL